MAANFPDLPELENPNPDNATSHAQSWAALQATYVNANSVAQWAASLVNDTLVDISAKLGKDLVSTDLAAVKTALDNIELYAQSASFIYTAPGAPTYDTVPSYQQQTLGTMLTVPSVETITVPEAPSSDITFTNSDFSDTLADSLRSKLAADLGSSSTGLGDAEAGLFARAVQRENDVLADSYTSITTNMASRGFDIPPGAMDALMAQEDNKRIIRLTDVNTGILETSAKLAQSWNQTTVTEATQVTELLSRIFDSKVMREFEAAKQKVVLALEGFKQIVSVALAKADLNKTAIAATISANQGTVEVFKAGIEGQVTPIKAISESNQAKASAYGAAVQAAKSNLEAQTLPEELKLKGVVANAQIAESIAGITLEEAKLAIETAARELTLETTVLQGVAQGAQQMVAAAWNSVNTSSSFGWSAGASTSYDGDIAAKIASAEKIEGV